VLFQFLLCIRDVLRGGGVGVFAVRIDGGGVVANFAFLFVLVARCLVVRCSYLGVLGWTK
jgi:hypothetical protein